jgi:hypothetical protein
MLFPGEKWLKTKNVAFSLNFDHFGPLRGAASKVAWNAVRTSLWMAWWGLPTYILGGLVGRVVAASMQLGDPRLQQFSQDMNRNGVKSRAEAAKERQQSGLPPLPEQHENGQDDLQPSTDVQPIHGRIQNMQSTGTTQTTKSSEVKPVPQFSATSKEPDDGGFGGFQSQDRPASFDASGQSNSAVGTGSSAWDRVRNDSRQQESAWDRVRRQGTSSGSQSSPSSWQSRATNDGNNVPLTDSFTFDEREEDRQLARVEAQRDFNARIERERQGKDFSDTKRW